MEVSRIIYMNSFGRSGETLMLRALDAHRDIHALVQLLARGDENEESYRLFQHIMEETPNDMSCEEPLRRAIGQLNKKNLLVKAAVWEPRSEAPGFVLIRNPFSVVQSYLNMFGRRPRKRRRHRPIARWMTRIDKSVAQFVNKCDVVTAICVAWNRRYSTVALRQKPIVHYERFVSEPQTVLQELLRDLQIPWDPAVLESHTKYASGRMGHGKIKLWEPIHAESLASWKQLEERQIRKIRSLCYPVMTEFGYNQVGGELFIGN